VKASLAKPLDIPVPPASARAIQPVTLHQAIPALPIHGIRAVRESDIPRDERSLGKSLWHDVQVSLYCLYSPMQPGLPPVDPDPALALRRAYTWPRKAKLPPPVLPAEFLGSPDLGSLAVRGPYACYTEKHADGIYKWDLEELGRYQYHEGLQTLGMKVFFQVDPMRRQLRPFRIDTALGSAGPGEPTWETSKKIAMCAVGTHLSLVRHFNWTHLASGAHLAIATRNRLPARHPLCRLLWPHMYGTQQSNDMVTKGQMVRGGDFETTFSFTFQGMCQLFEDTYPKFRLSVNDPEVDAETRRIRHAGFDTPTLENLEALFNVMHEHARHYLAFHYPDSPAGASTTAIRNDAHILAWLDELNALIPNGVEVTRTNVTFENLARLIARFIYLVTAQHEIIGGFLWNYQLWTHRQPIRVYRNGQREPLDVYQRLVNANYNLNVTRRALTDDFSYLVCDAASKTAFIKFRNDLRALQASMEREPWVVWKLYPNALKVNINA
jgi:arachidonate 15-lipoxygenase